MRRKTSASGHGRLLIGSGLRFDEFRYDVEDKVDPGAERSRNGPAAGREKATLPSRPLVKCPLTLHANYGRGINSIDARGVVQRPDQPRLATTDFYQFGHVLELEPVFASAPMCS